MTGTCFNIQRYSIQDGPGIRTTVFLKGCPLACTWCHNPEGLSPDPQILVVAERCMGCGACSEVCPNPPPVGGEGDDTGDWSRCVACGRCVEVCPTGARRLVGTSFTVDELLERIERDRAFYETSQGGVTFSGGEPLMQGEFLLASLEECRKRGLHAAVDTSGYAERDLVLEVGRQSDLILYDLKVLDGARHGHLTGVPLEPILENLRALDEAGERIWIRFPLVPGVTDGDANLEALGGLVSSLRNTRRVSLLPFHRAASDKYGRLGRRWSHGGLEPAPDSAQEGAAARLRGFGLEVTIGA